MATQVAQLDIGEHVSHFIMCGDAFDGIGVVSQALPSDVATRRRVLVQWLYIIPMCIWCIDIWYVAKRKHTFVESTVRSQAATKNTLERWRMKLETVMDSKKLTIW